MSNQIVNRVESVASKLVMVQSKRGFNAEYDGMKKRERKS